MSRAPYATDPSQSRGRLFPEAESPIRTAFARDRDRLIHSTAFRRLRYKTQVFVAPDGDHFRVRLTHSLEVAQIARTIARVLGLDEDLPKWWRSATTSATRRSATAARMRCSVMAPYGGFDHNGHAVRILTLLEARTPAHDGLNLSWEVLEGLAKHNGPVSKPGWALAAQEAQWPLELSSYAGLEAQVAALADDIAYNAHDLDDGLRAGLLQLDAVCAAVPLVDTLWRQVKARWPGESRANRLVPQLVRDLIGAMVDSLLTETRRNLAEIAPRSVAEIRDAGRPTAAFSAPLLEELGPLRRYLMGTMYTHASVKRIRVPAEETVEALFRALHSAPEQLPERWRDRCKAEEEPWRARIVGDYVAGMTDRFAIREHRRLTGRDLMPHDAGF